LNRVKNIKMKMRCHFRKYKSLNSVLYCIKHLFRVSEYIIMPGKLEYDEKSRRKKKKREKQGEEQSESHIELRMQRVLRSAWC